MYEQKKKRRVKFDQYDNEYHARQRSENVKPAHKRGFGWLEKFGWFCGYGLELHGTEETSCSYTVAIIENDYDQVELIPVHLITFMPS